MGEYTAETNSEWFNSFLKKQIIEEVWFKNNAIQTLGLGPKRIDMESQNFNFIRYYKKVSKHVSLLLFQKTNTVIFKIRLPIWGWYFTLFRRFPVLSEAYPGSSQELRGAFCDAKSCFLYVLQGSERTSNSRAITE